MVGAGVAAALHVGKLAPAIAPLQQALGLTLVQAGFLLSLVQLAGMAAGVAFGVVADAIGARRSMVGGLLLLGAASVLGGFASGVVSLMALRAVEGFGFLLVVLPAPGLVRRLVAPERLPATIGIWGAYMPLATALALLAGPVWIGAFGWRSWWWLLGAIAVAAAAWLARAVPATTAPRPPPAGLARLRRTLASRGAWLVALTFAMYSSQWLAVVGFLPTIYSEAGVAGAATGALTALAAAVNIGGNVGGGRLLQRGVAPPALLATGFVVMGLAGVAAFAGTPGLPPALRYVAVLAFSLVGGAIPTTLFALALRAAPDADAASTTVGWAQQWSSFGQFAGPPVVGWLAHRTGGWQSTWIATGACAVAGLALTAGIAAWLRSTSRR